MDFSVTCPNKFPLLFKVYLSRILCYCKFDTIRYCTTILMLTTQELASDPAGLRAQSSVRLPLLQTSAKLWGPPGHSHFGPIGKNSGVPMTPHVKKIHKNDSQNSRRCCNYNYSFILKIQIWVSQMKGYTG